LRNGDAVGVVIGCLERCGGCFGACVTACVGSSGGECGGDVAIVEAVVDACDGDGLGRVPVGGGEGQRGGAEVMFCAVIAGDGDGDGVSGLGVENDSE